MARRKVSGSAVIARRLVPSRILVEVGPDDPAWTGGSFPIVAGAIVKCVPPFGVSDSVVEGVRAKLLDGGAQHVRVLPARRPAPGQDRRPEDAPGYASLRDAVLDSVRGSRFARVPELSVYLGQKMDQVGL